MTTDLEKAKAKYKKLFDRGVLSWRETLEGMTYHGFTVSDVEELIGTEQEYIDALPGTLDKTQ